MLLELFPVTVKILDFSKDPLLDRLIEIVGSSEARAHSIIENDPSSYGTAQHILDHPDLASLKQRLLTVTLDFCDELDLAPVKIINSWFNRQTQGSRVLPHRHQTSIISGAFYIKMPPGAPGLRVHSPYSGHRQAEYRRGNGIDNTDVQDLVCRRGTLVLFPSWLEHSVPPNQAEERWVVSFNTMHDFGGTHLTAPP